MLLYSISGPFFALFAVASAAPNVLEARASCNADNCLRAIRASTAKPGSASASSDCVSFFKKTVTPCVVTISTTVIVSTDIPTVTTTLSLTATVSADSTTTVTVVVPTTVVVDAPLQPRRVLGATPNIEARNAAPVAPAVAAPVVTCNPVRSPTLVPTYASACSGTVRYSSACSCIAVTQYTTTLAPVSTTTTFTSTTTTVSITPTFTVSITVATVTTGGTVTASTTIISTITSACPTALPKACNGQCKNLNSDKYNCGTCGNVCPATQNSCSGGQCRSPNACSSIYNFCGIGTGQSCLCYETTEGQGYCAVNGGSCGNTTCNGSSDCPNGLACLIDCARTGWRGTCTYGADQNICGNAATRVKKWLESGGKRDGVDGSATGPFRPYITATQR